MAEKTIIAWTGATHNFWWGCTKVSPGCDHCYADTLAHRRGQDVWGKDKPRRILSAANNRKPYKWDKEAALNGTRLRVFCGSMMDWAENHETANSMRPLIWQTIRDTPHLDWQLLTKRADRVKHILPEFWDEIKGHVWIGVSVESPSYLWRVDAIRDIDSAVRFISYEPALEPIANEVDLTNISWLIMGGESGPGYRPMDHQWARDVMARCRQSGTAFFFKQSAAPTTERGIELDGQIVREYPDDP